MKKKDLKKRVIELEKRVVSLEEIMVTDSKNKDSKPTRFMPNVKFKFQAGCLDDGVDFDFKMRFKRIDNTFEIVYGLVNKEGDSVKFFGRFEDWFNTVAEEVSVYEAIPESVSDGMVYSKELDKLVPENLEKEEQECEDCLYSKGCSVRFRVESGSVPVSLCPYFKKKK